MQELVQSQSSQLGKWDAAQIASKEAWAATESNFQCLTLLGLALRGKVEQLSSVQEYLKKKGYACQTCDRNF